MMQLIALGKRSNKLYYSPEFGNDETGDGTLRRPYRSYRGAVRKLPLQLSEPQPMIVNVDAK